MYAIIATGGKQYRVQEGDEIVIEKLEAAEGDAVVFDQVLAAGEGADIKVGTPVVEGAAVNAKVVENGKGKKVIIYKYKAKKDYRKKQGHRQPFTKLEILEVGGEKAPEKPAEEAVEAAPAEEVKEAPAAKAESVSMSMKKDELIAFAEEHGIEIDAKATKQVIIDTINENL